MIEIYRLGIFLLVLSVMLVWQTLSPARTFDHETKHRWLINFGLMFCNTAALRLLASGGAVFAAQFAVSHNIGVFQWFQLNPILAFGFGLLLLDCAIYWQHRLFHAIPVFWRLHRVHHADVGFDVSTAVRFHPVEIVLSMYVKMALALLLGLSAITVVVFEIILNGCALFNHGNVRIPGVWEQRVRRVLVTPDMHRIHHSTTYKEMNSNYGFSVSWWDRVFRTYVDQPVLGHELMPIGLPERRAGDGLGFWRMLAFPFQR